MNRPVSPRPVPAIIANFRFPTTGLNRPLFFAGFLLLAHGFSSLQAAQPGWWTARGAVVSSLTPNDQAAVTQGQLKRFTQQAVQEMNATLPGGAGTDLNNLVAGWQQEYQTNGWNASNPKPADFTVMNAGQLKFIAQKFWSRLVSVRYTTSAPSWLAVNAATDNLIVNLGQLKSVFAFDLTAPPGELPDWWQNFYFSGTGINPGVDSDGDDFTNLEEYLLGTNPANAGVGDSGGLINFVIERPF